MASVKLRLSIMMFVLLFVWGAWGATLGACFSANGLGDATADVYSAGPLAAIIAPLFLGLIADRFFASQNVFGVLMLLAAGFIYAAIGYAQQGDGGMVYWMFLGHMLCYMPTLGLSNTIAFSNIDDPNQFPAIRVWGTLGWIAAGLLIGGVGWSTSFNILWLSFGASLLMAAYAFTLPHTPPPAKGQPFNLSSLLMLDAFRLLAEPAFAVFMLCSTLICVPLAYYYSYTSNLLTTAGFEQAASTMTLGQMSEVVFMLMIPLLFRRLGVKWMILIGMAAWVARYLLFAFGAPDQVIWMLLAGVILHGVCYDFLFVTGFMYTDQRAAKEVRGQAQSMLVFFTQGVGMFLGFRFAKWRFAETMTREGDLATSIGGARASEELTFFEQLTSMFNVSMPEGVDAALITETMSQWRAFWLLPAYMAAAILVLFFAAFWDTRPKPAGAPSEAST